MPVAHSPSYQRVHAVKPKYIFFNNGRIEFNLTSRDDIYSDIFGKELKRLNSIVVQSLDESGQYKDLKKFEFHYSYFISDKTMIDSRDPSRLHPDCLRLRLDSISQRGDDHGLVSKPIIIARFNYHNEHPLPMKNSFKVDHWGYYNGQANATPIPYHVIEFQWFLSEIGGAIKNPVVDFMKSGTLESIIYPTKGKTRFGWEMNRYGSEKPVFYENLRKSVSLYSIEDPRWQHDKHPLPPQIENDIIINDKHPTYQLHNTGRSKSFD